RPAERGPRSPTAAAGAGGSRRADRHRLRALVRLDDDLPVAQVDHDPAGTHLALLVVLLVLQLDVPFQDDLLLARRPADAVADAVEARPLDDDLLALDGQLDPAAGGGLEDHALAFHAVAAAALHLQLRRALLADDADRHRAVTPGLLDLDCHLGGA